MWHYFADGQQLGPVDEQALDQLIASGAINGETFVWKDGMADWSPLAQVRPMTVAVSTVPTESAGEACSMCGKNVGADNLIDLLGVRVCASCKPKAVQSFQEGTQPAVQGDAWRDGKIVVTQRNGRLPARCYKCNHAVEDPPLKRTVYWHPMFYFIIVFFSPIIYIIVALIVRKRAPVEIYLCRQHTQRRKYFMMGGWIGSLVSFLLVGVGIVEKINSLVAIGFLLLLVAIIAGIAGSVVARASRIQGDTIWLRGANREFLASLPQWNK